MVDTNDAHIIDSNGREYFMLAGKVFPCVLTPKEYLIKEINNTLCVPALSNYINDEKIAQGQQPIYGPETYHESYRSLMTTLDMFSFDYPEVADLAQRIRRVSIGADLKDIAYYEAIEKIIHE